MNIYLTKKQKKAMDLLLMTAEELLKQAEVSVKEEFEELMESVTELKAKLDKRPPLLKNGVVFSPVEIACTDFQDVLIIRPREDGRAIILESKNRKADKSGRYRFRLGKENAKVLTDEIIKYLNAWGIDFQAEEKSYTEEINVFADKVERSISVSNGTISFLCYTDDPKDDHWTFLTPYKAKYFVELMLGYINQADKIAG